MKTRTKRVLIDPAKVKDVNYNKKKIHWRNFFLFRIIANGWDNLWWDYENDNNNIVYGREYNTSRKFKTANLAILFWAITMIVIICYLIF